MRWPAGVVRWLRERAWTGHWMVALFFVVVTVMAMRPLLANAAGHLANKPNGDQLWQAALLDGQLLALWSDPASFLQGNFYFGSGNALFGSDLLLGLLPIFAPLRLVTGDEIVAFNLTWHIAFGLSAFCMYLAVLTLTHDRLAALAAGTVFGFGALQLNYGLAHFQFAGAWWIPLTLLFGVRFARSRGWRVFGLATLCVGLQFVTAVHLGYIAGFVLVAFAIVPGVWWSLRNRDWRVPLRSLAVTVVVGALFAPFALGYLEYSRDWAAERDISEVQNGSLQLRDYLSPSSRLAWYGGLQERFPVPTGERRAFPGFVPFAAGLLGGIVGLLGAVALLRGRSSRRSFPGYVLGSGALFLLAVVLSLGPNWKWHEEVTDFALPYRFLYDNFASFRAVRIVARFALLANFALALLAGVLVTAAAARLRRRRRGGWAAPAVGVLLVAAVLGEAATAPLNVPPVPEDLGLAATLGDAPEGPLLFVPVSGAEEIGRIWMTTVAGKGPLVNGYSGAIWPQYWFFRDATRDVTRQGVEDLLRALAAVGVRGVVIDLAKLEARDEAIWRAAGAGPAAVGATDSFGWLVLTLPQVAERPDGDWAELDVFLPLETAPAAMAIQAPLVLRNQSPDPWLPPRDATLRTVTVRWRDAGGAVIFAAESSLLPPPFLAAGGTYDSLLRLPTPADAGIYGLELELAGGMLLQRDVRVGAIATTAFDGTGEGLRARLRLVTEDEFTGQPAERLPLLVTALNLGPVTWGGEANIRLGWRWFQVQADGSEVEMTGYEGRIVLLGHLVGDILPGNGYAFRGMLRLPDAAGEYVVRVAPLAELVAWFPGEPATIRVTVLGD
ncbi:MAG: hypothetical protein QF719_05370 [Chloroflexota bacterium]|nr:hypothetical protein [Chloroflexota bacterium]MDP6757628.1 hypothetical protein [Chloroflexota bacterium]